MIVVEGCDKCGKTSIAAKLAERLGWPVVKFSQPASTDPCDEYMAALAARPAPFIADRFHLGERVYGPLYRGTPPPDHKKMRAIEDELIRRRALLILMWDTGERVRWRFVDHREAFARGEHVRRILDAFDAAWAGSRVKKIKLKWSADSSRQRVIVDRAIRALESPW